MSKVAIVGDPSGTGTFTISAPNGNTDRTLVLPDEAGTVLTSAGVPASAMPAGSVIQVVQNALTQQISTTSTTDSVVISQAITPLRASSKILVIATCPSLTPSNTEVWYSLYRNSTKIVAEDKHGSGTGPSFWVTVALQRLDSPNTTSSVTYSLQFRTNLAGSATYSGTGVGGTNNTSITLLEISA